MGGTDYQLLLTDDARRAHLQNIFGNRFRHQGKLQLPSIADYSRIVNADGLHEVGIEICRWIGLKPSGLTITFGKVSPAAGFTINAEAKVVELSPVYKYHPYSLGALLAFAITAYAINKFDHTPPNREFTEFASIELGLGLWVVNALQPKVKTHYKLYHLLDSSWHQHEVLTLSGYTPSQYIELLTHYAHENRIPPDAYLPHVLKRSQYLFNGFTRSQTNRYLPESHSSVLHKRSAQLLWLKLLIGALIIASAAALAIFIATSSSPAVDQEKLRQTQEIERLRSAYSDCQGEAAKQQSSYDPNDLFLTRQVDATKSRCESLRNEYNYAVDQYTNAN